MLTESVVAAWAEVVNGRKFVKEAVKENENNHDREQEQEHDAQQKQFYFSEFPGLLGGHEFVAVLAGSFFLKLKIMLFYFV